MFMICLRYGRDRAEAEDMLQEGFMQVFKDIHQFRGSGNLEAWMSRVMVRAALNHLRKWKGRSFLSCWERNKKRGFSSKEVNDHLKKRKFIIFPSIYIYSSLWVFTYLQKSPLKKNNFPLDELMYFVMQK